MTNYFTFNAPNKPTFLKLDSKINFKVFFHDDSHLINNLKDCNETTNNGVYICTGLTNIFTSKPKCSSMVD
jgi:hypothetical protein